MLVGGIFQNSRLAVGRRTFSQNYSRGQVELSTAFDSIVKVFTVSASPNWFMPWQTKQQREITGSGFVIEGRRQENLE